jgi:hypothetical protein
LRAILTNGNSTALTVAKAHLANLMGAHVFGQQTLTRRRLFLIE